MEPIDGIEDIPKQRWKLVLDPFGILCFKSSANDFPIDLLYLSTTNGRLHSVQQQKLLYRFSCHLCPEGQTIPQDEEFWGWIGIQSSQRLLR